MEVTPGYKLTEVGLLPEDWEVRAMEEVALVTSGKRLPLGSSLVDQPTPHPYIRVTDMRPGTVDLSEIKYVPERIFPAIKQYRIYQSDLFISVAGSLGIVGKIPEELDGANLTENADRITAITCSQDYLLYVLMSPLIQNTINAIRTVGAQPKLALTRIRQFSIPLPSTEREQRAIAAALSDVDALLGGLDRLIAKKRNLLIGTTQRLLTGETRLPGFTAPWRARRLGEMGRFLKGSGITRGEALSGELPCVRYGEIYTTHHNVVRQFMSRISRAVADDATRIQFRDLLFAGSGETKEEIGKCVSLAADVEAYAGGDIIILRPYGGNPVFLGYLMNIPQVARQKANRGQGDAVVHISAKALAAIEVLLPDEREQDAIAEVLSDMDAEITALEARFDKTRDLRQAMMQALLTGRVRLTFSAEETSEPVAVHA